MGYDRTGRPAFEIPVSDTQAYRQFGNGVVVPVIEAVAKHMKPHILGETNVIAGQMRLPLFAVSEM
jgi:DNA (cytosine-5)-methyltransferase 1